MVDWTFSQKIPVSFLAILFFSMRGSVCRPIVLTPTLLSTISLYRMFASLPSKAMAVSFRRSVHAAIVGDVVLISKATVAYSTTAPLIKLSKSCVWSKKIPFQSPSAGPILLDVRCTSWVTCSCAKGVPTFRIPWTVTRAFRSNLTVVPGGILRIISFGISSVPWTT